MTARRRGLRPARQGEVCFCGRTAVQVWEHPAFGGAFGQCLDHGPEDVALPCPFCGRTGPHAETGWCPNYQLRPVAPLLAEPRHRPGMVWGTPVPASSGSLHEGDVSNV